MRRRERGFLCVTLLLGALAGCNSAGPPESIASSPPSRGVASSDFKLPEGSGCGGAIARYRSIVDNDLSMGHVDKSVYDQIHTEIGGAEGACASGQDAKAMSLVRASKAKHGYPG